MMESIARWASILGLFGLLLWAGNAQASFCRNNLPASNPDDVYIEHGNGTVTDTRTGLMWKQCAEGLSGLNCQSGSSQTFEAGDALEQATASNFAGYNDWRLPNVKELSSLVEVCRAFPAINTNLFPNTPVAVFWSNSPTYGSRIFSVAFSDGNVGREPLTLFPTLRIRLVRGGQ